MFAADQERLALTLKAQSEFEHVETAGTPDLRNTISCIQSQASVLPVTAPEELPLIHFRKGFCTLAGATITRNANEFTDAAGEFEKAIEGWPARALSGGKNKPPEQLPSALRVLASIARLNAGLDEPGMDRAQAQIASAVENPACASTIMSSAFCNDVMRTGRQWLGWMAVRHDFLADAARYFSGSEGTGWPEWVGGRQAFHDQRYKEAATQYRLAIDLARRDATGSLIDHLGPRHDLPSELAELGGAQFLAGDAAKAIATLDEAAKSDPSNARALYLRARAKEVAGQMDGALADYNLASRTAFASAKDLASGEAHLYRGILLLRRKDYGHAEDEFSSALNFEISTGLRADAAAWRHLAAVANGSCAASRQLLERSLATVSPYFPKEEARALMAACPATASVGR